MLSYLHNRGQSRGKIWYLVMGGGGVKGDLVNLSDAMYAANSGIAATLA